LSFQLAAFHIATLKRREASRLAPFCCHARFARARSSSDKCLQAVGVLIDLLLEWQEQGVKAHAIGDFITLQVQQGQDGAEASADAQEVVADFEDVVLKGDRSAGWGQGGFGEATGQGAVGFGQVLGKLGLPLGEGGLLGSWGGARFLD